MALLEIIACINGITHVGTLSFLNSVWIPRLFTPPFYTYSIYD